MARNASGTKAPFEGSRPRDHSPSSRSEVEVRILDAAAELVAAIGLRVTIDMIAKGARVGRATIYRHFDSKEAVLGAMARREIFEEFTKIAARTVEESDARAKAVALYAAIFQAAVTNPILRRIALDDPKALLGLQKVREPVDLPATIRDALKGALDDVRAEGGRTAATSRTAVIADAFMNTVSGYLLSDFDPPREITALAEIVARMSVDAGLDAES